MDSYYLEREKYGNGYRKTYQEGLVSLLKTLKEQAQRSLRYLQSNGLSIIET